jgi:Holliday junction resolvasome RuvABC ATP-dependent DNA helicase subunit
MFLLASRPVAATDMSISPLFWERLFDQGVKEGNVLSLELSAMTKENLEQLVKKYAVQKESALSNHALSTIAKDTFVQSGGMPQLAAQLLDRKFFDTSEESSLRPKVPKKVS